MKRRDFLAATTLVLTGGFAMADVPKVQSLDDALRWLDRLDQAAGAKTTGQWPLVSVLEHMAQSVEMSLDGFPQPKSAMFQNTAGAAAFAFFKWRGQMSHSLSEPIPGAAALSRDGDWHAASARLRAAIARFTAHQGPLKPHFAYGALSKADFSRAHTFHIANHQDEIVLVAR
ncbi:MULTISPECIES: DUF1569 domain-containing protein [unclassified Polaromonas]|uniref:DUF1569 domain-containing protein n=1 Tax=unclassified Polaromonas TaxID=2638319 RepID=UPI000F07818A|nr:MULTISPECIES: DUF1569 domain-containing protein [unclassified Polaromonas]AYQ28655.1 DUF1569 domain-containing protein [Polaromonas sp. SP1]QGJ20228.1 DUF1569 domain-containing protein [Polaromonas sp. Pch-P]